MREARRRFCSRAPLPFLKHAVAKLSGTWRGCCRPCRFGIRLEGNGGSALGRKRCPLAAVPKAGWGKRLPPACLRHFDKEPVNAGNRVRTSEFGPSASNTRANLDRREFVCRAKF